MNEDSIFEGRAGLEFTVGGSNADVIIQWITAGDVKEVLRAKLKETQGSTTFNNVRDVAFSSSANVCVEFNTF